MTSEQNDDFTWFVFNIKPKPKGRPRFTQKGRFVGTYTDKKTREYESAISQMAQQQYSRTTPMQGSISMIVRFIYKKPPKTKAKTPGGRQDLDNLIKSILDAFNKIIFADDSQIIRILATKEWSDEASCVKVKLLEM